MNKEQWQTWAVEKYGSLDEARAIRRRVGALSPRNKGKDSGFAKLAREDPERHKEITSRGGKSRAQKINAANQGNAQSEDSDQKGER